MYRNEIVALKQLHDYVKENYKDAEKAYKNGVIPMIIPIMQQKLL